jgi:integrase
MGRTKTAGIIATVAGYDIDKVYKGERIRQRAFKSFEAAEECLIRSMERINQMRSTDQRVSRRFDEAAAHYLEKFSMKRSIVSDGYHLKAVMPFVGDLLLDRVHNGTLQAFISDRKKNGRKNKTINLSLAIVSRILKLSAADWRDENGMTWLAQAPIITLEPLNDQRQPRPIMWPEQRRLLPALPDHMAEMILFALNTGARDDVICNLQWSWEVEIPQLGILVFIVPLSHVKGEEGTKQEGVVVCNAVAKAIIERQRGKHDTHVFVYRRERVKHKDKAPVMPYRPITRMSNSAWYTAREAAGLDDLHVHDMRHTVGLRMREANISERTQDDVLWHSRKTMTAHYSQAQIVEIFEALEKIKDESCRYNISLSSIRRHAKIRRLTQNSPA